MSFQIKYVYQLVDQISPKIEKIQRNFESSTNKVRQAAAKTSRSFDNMKNKLGGVGKKANELGKSLFLKTTVPIALLGASFVKAASNAEETASKFATVFKDVDRTAQATANNLAKSFGLSSIKAKELLGDTGDLLTGFGFTGKAALDLAKQTNELAVDLASFTNFSGGAEGASKALTKALLGERESVKSLGISILEEDVKKKISILRSQGVRFESERQAKAIATLKIAYEQSKNAIGDFARTKKSFANQTRILGARFLDLKIKLGNILLPVALKLVQVITKLVEKFTNLSPITQKIILVLGALAAILPPLLISLGLLAVAIGAISAPVILAVAGLTSLIYAVKKGVDFFSDIDRSIEKTIHLVKNLGTVFKEAGRFIRGLFGANVEAEEKTAENLARIERMKKIKTNIASRGLVTPSAIPQSSDINQQQNLSMGGQLDINFRNAPKGMQSIMTPVKNNAMPIFTNSVYGGA